MLKFTEKRIEEHGREGQDLREIKGAKPVKDSKLRWYFHNYNIQFFQGKIPPSTPVFFVKNLKRGRTRCDGLHEGVTGSIKIDESLREHESLAVIVLIHEMAHAYLDIKGCSDFDDHGMIYQAELVRLFNAGGYTGLL
jgi:hypothetical protein